MTTVSKRKYNTISLVELLALDAVLSTGWGVTSLSMMLYGALLFTGPYLACSGGPLCSGLEQPKSRRSRLYFLRALSRAKPFLSAHALPRLAFLLLLSRTGFLELRTQAKGYVFANSATRRT